MFFNTPTLQMGHVTPPPTPKPPDLQEAKRGMYAVNLSGGKRGVVATNVGDRSTSTG